MRIALLLPLLFAFVASAAPRIDVERCPNSGIEPQMIVDAHGVTHLLFFLGDPKAGDLFYTLRSAGQREFSIAHRVNEVAGAAMVVGGVRGPQMTLDRIGNAVFLWTGSDAAQPKPR